MHWPIIQIYYLVSVKNPREANSVTCHDKQQRRRGRDTPSFLRSGSRHALAVGWTWVQCPQNWLGSGSNVLITGWRCIQKNISWVAIDKNSFVFKVASHIVQYFIQIYLILTVYFIHTVGIHWSANLCTFCRYSCALPSTTWDHRIPTSCILIIHIFILHPYYSDSILATVVARSYDCMNSSSSSC